MSSWEREEWIAARREAERRGEPHPVNCACSRACIREHADPIRASGRGDSRTS